MRPDSFTSSRAVVSKIDNPSSPSGYLLAAQAATGKPQGYLGNSGTVKSVTASSALTKESWKHLALSFAAPICASTSTAN